MSDIKDDLNILITGDTATGRKLVANVVGEALEDAGFADVRLVNNIGEAIDKEDVPTILDLVQESRPDLFEKSVTIQTRPAEGETDDLTTGNDDDMSEEEPINPEDEALASMLADPDAPL